MDSVSSELGRSKAHACHNEEVCALLLDHESDFNDWVVTTAFYSSLHFVEHKIFPLRDKPDFGEYFSLLPQSSKARGLHSVRADLVKAQLGGSIGAKYRDLLDASWNARYQDYQVSKAKAHKAFKNLQAIKEACMA